MRPSAAATVFPSLTSIERTSPPPLHTGHDGRQGHGDPAAALERREHAVAVGVLEGLAIALSSDSRGGSPRSTSNPGLLESALRALQRIGLGYDAATDRRNQRALKAGLVPTIIQLLEKHRVQNPQEFPGLARQTVGVLHEQIKVPDAIWEEEMGKYPALMPAIVGMGR